ncbi:hypothetical protein GTQ43_10870 [Nostoc sp. KVJ3]|nr:hypothetical protein [Nostoc sp. KVJ3]
MLLFIIESNHSLKLKRRQFLLRSTITAGGIIATNLASKSQVFAQAPAIITKGSNFLEE